MGEKKNYVEEMDEVIRRYSGDPDAMGLYSVLCGVFEGIEQNYSLPCPAEMNLENGQIRPMFLKKKDGKEHLAVLTNLDGEEYPAVADVKIRSLIRLVFNTESCEGIIINPFEEHKFFVPKQFLAYALAAGYRMAEDDYTEDDYFPSEEKSPHR